MKLSNTATCPACLGATKDSAGKPCQNCGGQYMFGRATGQVRTRSDGTACTHEYHGRASGRCATSFACVACGDTYMIDSGG